MAKCALLTQSFHIVNAPIILLFSKNWVVGLTDEDKINNIRHKLVPYSFPGMWFTMRKSGSKLAFMLSAVWPVEFQTNQNFHNQLTTQGLD